MNKLIAFGVLVICLIAVTVEVEATCEKSVVEKIRHKIKGDSDEDLLKTVGCKAKEEASKIEEGAKKLGKNLSKKAKKFDEKRKSYSSQVKSKLGEWKQEITS